MELRDLHPRTLVLRTFSKAYGLAGLRVGYAVGSPDAIAWLERLRAPFNVNALGQAAAVAALEDQAHLARAVELNAQERERVSAELSALGFSVAPSQANFVLVAVDEDAKTAYEWMVRRGVILRAFGPPLERHLRVSLGTSDENTKMIQAFKLLSESTDERQPAHAARAT